MNLLSILTFVALIALSVDVIMQARQLLKTHSSEDISVWGAEIRLVAVAILVVKFASVRDPALFAGQLILLLVFIWYFALIVRFRRRRNKK